MYISAVEHNAPVVVDNKILHMDILYLLKCLRSSRHYNCHILEDGSFAIQRFTHYSRLG
jgi:hypothetical protein